VRDDGDVVLFWIATPVAAARHIRVASRALFWPLVAHHSHWLRWNSRGTKCWFHKDPCGRIVKMSVAVDSIIEVLKSGTWLPATVVAIVDAGTIECLTDTGERLPVALGSTTWRFISAHVQPYAFVAGQRVCYAAPYPPVVSLDCLPGVPVKLGRVIRRNADGTYELLLADGTRVADALGTYMSEAPRRVLPHSSSESGAAATASSSGIRAGQHVNIRQRGLPPRIVLGEVMFVHPDDHLDVVVQSIGGACLRVPPADATLADPLAAPVASLGEPLGRVVRPLEELRARPPWPWSTNPTPEATAAMRGPLVEEGCDAAGATVRVGDTVRVNWRGYGTLYPGRVAFISRSTGSGDTGSGGDAGIRRRYWMDIAFEDGDREGGVDSSRVFQPASVPPVIPTVRAAPEVERWEGMPLAHIAALETLAGRRLIVPPAASAAAAVGGGGDAAAGAAAVASAAAAAHVFAAPAVPDGRRTSRHGGLVPTLEELDASPPVPFSTSVPHVAPTRDRGDAAVEGRAANGASLRRGDRVSANWKSCGTYFSGFVFRVYASRSHAGVWYHDIQYDDGE